MKSNYKPIGKYIRLVDERNKGLKHTNLLGVSISKQFIPSVANIIGTDMENYKIIRENQFACSTMQVRRDKKMPVALYLENEPSIISQAYPIFEIINTEELLPEYLMMWFTRSEFDREACFNAVGGVRGSLEWEDFCNMQLPIPSIEKQKEIVKEFHILVDRIVLNNQLIVKLEETAQAIYKQWFVDFEFPDENGLPYKSNGGVMIESELGEIPKGWEAGLLNEVKCSTLGGDWGKDLAMDNYTREVYCIRGTDIPASSNGKKGKIPIRFILEKNLLNRKLEASDIVTEISGGSPTQSTGRSVFISEEYLNYLNKPAICSNFCRVIKAKENFSEYLYCTIKYLYNAGVLFTYENSSNGVKNLALEDLFNEEIIIIPEFNKVKEFKKIFISINRYINSIGTELEKLDDLNSLILSKMATIENLKELVK